MRHWLHCCSPLLLPLLSNEERKPKAIKVPLGYCSRFLFVSSTRFHSCKIANLFFFNNNLVHIDQSLITKLIGIVSSPVDGFSYDSNKAVRCLSCQHKSLIIRPDALAVMQMPVVAIYSCALYTG